MKPKTLILLGVAIGCGLLASYMTSRVIADRSQAPEVAKVPVVFATKNIPSGFLVKNAEEYFQVRMVPEDIAPRSKVIHDLAELKDKRVVNPVGADKHISLDDLLGNDQMGLTWKIPPGMRAVSVKVAQDTSVGGFVLPGMHVDIMCVPNGKNECNTILQRVLVLAVNQTDQPDREKKAMETHYVTFAVSPDDSNKLALAAHSGHLRLSLRHGEDDKIATTRGARADDLTRTSEVTEVGPTEGGNTGTQPVPVQPLAVTPAPGQPDTAPAIETSKVEPAQPKVVWQLKIQQGPRVEVVKFFDEPPIDVEKSNPEADTPRPTKKETKDGAGPRESKSEESPGQPAKRPDGQR